MAIQHGHLIRFTSLYRRRTTFFIHVSESRVRLNHAGIPIYLSVPRAHAHYSRSVLPLAYFDPAQMVVENEPIGIRKMSTETGYSHHTARYSFRILEGDELIEPLSQSALTIESVDEFTHVEHARTPKEFDRKVVRNAPSRKNGFAAGDFYRMDLLRDGDHPAEWGWVDRRVRLLEWGFLFEICLKV